jgi:ABC-type glutathione transport system ATPase component
MSIESAYLSLEDVHVQFRSKATTGGTQVVHAVRGVSLDVARGEILGLVGESGCGKTTLSRCIMQLVRPTQGQILLDGLDLTMLPPAQLRKARTSFQMVFQDPYASLNPRMSIFSTLREALEVGEKLPPGAAASSVANLMETVGLDPRSMLKYPHEFSGGQRQRIAIARALAPRPKLLLADEPVSALDVSIQSQIINLLMKLSRELNLTLIFVSHDLGVVRFIADRVAVMHAGQIIEIGETAQIMNAPQQEYTKTLLAARPTIDLERLRRQQAS